MTCLTALAACAGPRTTLHEAAQRGDTRTVLLLLDQGADVNARADRDKMTGMTPLHWAAKYGQTETVKALLARGADINARTEYSGETAIQLAVTPYKVVEGQTEGERGETVSVLLEAGADVHNKSKGGQTLLCSAAYWLLSSEIVGKILDKAGDIEEPGDRGRSPLHCAAGSPYDRRHTVRLLLARGAKVNARDDHGKSVLAIAAQVGNTEVVRMLLAKGADPGLKDQEGYTALDRAESNKQKDVMALLERAIAKQQPVTPSSSGPSPGLAAAPAASVSDVDRPPAGTTATTKHAYAVVIGIEQYQQSLPRADFAAHDARIMGRYLNQTLGYAEEHVVVLLNDRATKNGLEKYIEGWLPDHVEAGDSVFVYFSGHGAPNARTGKAYLVPFDGDPAFVEQTGYPLDRLYDRLAALPAKNVVVMLDSCFSGGGGRSVIGKGMRPMVLSVENPLLAKGKVVVLAASGGNQVSSTYDQQSHGLLTYFFLKGLNDADLAKDGRIDLRELYDYLKPQVERTARRDFHNEQTPQLLGNSDVVSQTNLWMGKGKP